LELAGHRVRVASDGLAGLEALLSGPAQIALVDIGLPEMDGYELARRMRATLDDRARPFMVAVTGYGLPEDRSLALAAGCGEHLTKALEARAAGQPAPLGQPIAAGPQPGPRPGPRRAPDQADRIPRRGPGCGPRRG